ncbi:ABC transporter substrate-binding protein [Terasakiella sp. A23]|uniref:ABC transporter substrate-binding protein n=1 Tax=Terasakiella sp. FCG-A23 TaxID=3080561 RepID=UPI00295341DC|nr:ABC transporter substrate-binding protein [Terasakiella sp. A23]MDV7341225.1 ABC transporter substrate-binding protein [Terasakiella sp. A23]
MKRLLFLLVTLWMIAPAHARVERGVGVEEADVNVGCLFPLSGYGIGFGNDSIIGIELALEDIAKDLPDAPKMRVIIEDTKLKASRTIRHVRDFANQDKTQFVCGIVSSGIALEVTKIIDDLGVVFIGTDNASSRLTGSALTQNYFRVTNNTYQTMYAGAQYIRDSFGGILKKRPLRIAFIGPDYDYGYQNWLDLQSALEKLNIAYDPVATLWPSLFEVDFSAQIRSLLRVKADLIVNEQWGNDFITFMRQVNDSDLMEYSKIANFGSGGDYDVLAKLGNDLPQGLILSARHHVNWPETKENSSFVRRFYDRTGHYPSYVAQGAYSGILAIALTLIDTGGGTDLDDIRASLSKIEMKLPEDPNGFKSFMNAKDHQIQQVISIGETVIDHRFPPATRLIGNWKNYFPMEKTE